MEEYSERLLLYLPIEVLPGNDWVVASQTLECAIKEFKDVYLRKWNILLRRNDIRANFVDGDIPETELRHGPLPRVVKAAHLIPALVRKGFLSSEDIIEMEKHSNSILRASLAEILPCLPSNTNASNEKQVGSDKNMAWIIGRMQTAKCNLETLRKRLRIALHEKPLARVNWEIERDGKKITEVSSAEIAQVITGGNISNSEFEAYVRQADDADIIHIGILSLQKAIEGISRSNLGSAQTLYIRYAELFEHLRKNGYPRIQEVIEGTLSRLANARIFDQKQARDYGITLPRFDDDLKPDQDSYETAKDISKLIGESVELSPFLLPVVMVYGSRVKGYQSKKADLDIAVFVRDGIRFSERSYIQRLLSELLSTLGIKGKALEFWIEKTDDGFRIQDFVNPDRYLGDSTLIDVLFGGVWCGDYESIKYLYEQILAPYLSSKDEMVIDQPARELWLEEMERCALQYRLMHRGYHQFYPERKTLCIPENMVDTDGAFWDSGYRRLATKIFLKKVFLPYVPLDKKKQK